MDVFLRVNTFVGGCESLLIVGLIFSQWVPNANDISYIEKKTTFKLNVIVVLLFEAPLLHPLSHQSSQSAEDQSSSSK